MKKILAVIVAVVVILVIGSLGYVAVEGDIGDSEKAMRTAMQESTPEGWYLLESVGEEMAGFLKVEEGETDCDIHIYIRRDNAIGWFFRYGGSVMDPYANVYKMTMKNKSEYVLYSMNQLGVARIVMDKSANMGEDVEIREVTPGKPFVLVLDQGWEVTLYDAEGNEILPVEDPI